MINLVNALLYFFFIKSHSSSNQCNQRFRLLTLIPVRLSLQHFFSKMFEMRGVQLSSTVPTPVAQSIDWR